jgi:hypothetical protein
MGGMGWAVWDGDMMVGWKCGCEVSRLLKTDMLSARVPSQSNKERTTGPTSNARRRNRERETRSPTTVSAGPCNTAGLHFTHTRPLRLPNRVKREEEGQTFDAVYRTTLTPSRWLAVYD